MSHFVLRCGHSGDSNDHIFTLRDVIIPLDWGGEEDTRSVFLKETPASVVTELSFICDGESFVVHCNPRKERGR